MLAIISSLQIPFQQPDVRVAYCYLGSDTNRVGLLLCK